LTSSNGNGNDDTVGDQEVDTDNNQSLTREAILSNVAGSQDQNFTETLKDATDLPAKQGGDRYCLLCEAIVPSLDVPNHPTSILHNLSRSQRNSSSKVIQPLIPPTHYTLKSNNVGYAIMKKLGWKEDSALGRLDHLSAEDGLNTARKTPIRVVEKFDRKGVGVENKRKFEENEREGKIIKLPRQTGGEDGTAKKKIARPLAKNLKEMEGDRKRDMQFFKAGLAYLNS